LGYEDLAKNASAMNSRRGPLLCSLLTTFVLVCIPNLHTRAATLIITDIEDIDFGEVLPTANRVREQMRFCVNATPAGPYQVIGVGSGAGGAFTLSNGSGPLGQIGYDVYVSDRGNRLANQLTPNVPLGGLTARSPRADGRCQPPPVFLNVVIDTNDLSTAPGGEYQGLLQLTVAPE
jgi:hypothetical protein